MASKVREPCVVNLLHWTPTFEMYMAQLLVKNKHSRKMLYNEIGLRAQNTTIVLGLIFNKICKIHVFV